jgi:SAM-dependent methyltransferase
VAASPWLQVPLADYEGHMAHVGQAALLERLFGQAIRELQPRSVAVLGAAGGNGFGHLERAPVARTVAVDIHPDYVRELGKRYAQTVAGLEILCGDVGDPEFGFAPVDYVHAALVFEYVDAPAVLARVHRWLVPGGVLGVVLQLPGPASVSPSPYASLSALGSAMQLRDDDAFVELAAAAGLQLVARESVSAPPEKAFASLRFRVGHVRRRG